MTIITEAPAWATLTTHPDALDADAVEFSHPIGAVVAERDPQVIRVAVVQRDADDPRVSVCGVRLSSPEAECLARLLTSAVDLIDGHWSQSV